MNFLHLLNQTIILSLLPISELRGSIPLVILEGSNYWVFFVLVAILANIAIVPFTFFFLDNIHLFMTRFESYNFIFNKAVIRTQKKVEKHIGTKWEFFALYLLVAIPLPFTGAYTGSLAAWLFKLPRKKAIKYLILGIITAGIVVTIFMLILTSFLTNS